MGSRIPRTLSVILCIISMSCSRSTEETPQRVTITFWHSFVASTIPALDDLCQEFEKTQPSIHLRCQYIPTGDGLIQKLASAIQSKTTPDIAWIHVDFLDKLVEARAIVPLKDFLEGPEGLAPGDVQDIFPSLLQAGTYDGILYTLPMEATSLALFYNRGLFKDAGLDPRHPPQTWEELQEYALKLTSPPDARGRRTQYGFFVPVFPASGELNIWMNLQWAPFLWQAGGDELSPDGSHITFHALPGVRALSLWKAIYDAEDFGKFGLAHDLGFASQKLVMVLDGPWNLPRYRALKGVDWGVAPLPAGPAGRATYIAGEHLAIFRNSPHKAEAWRFMKWVIGREVQARFSMRSGYLPVRRSVLRMDEYRRFLGSDPALKTFVDQMDSGRGRQIIGRHRMEINRFLAEGIENAIVGGRDPAECLTEAALKANALLRMREE